MSTSVKNLVNDIFKNPSLISALTQAADHIGTTVDEVMSYGLSEEKSLELIDAIFEDEYYDLIDIFDVKSAERRHNDISDAKSGVILISILHDALDGAFEVFFHQYFKQKHNEYLTALIEIAKKRLINKLSLHAKHPTSAAKIKDIFSIAKIRYNKKLLSKVSSNIKKRLAKIKIEDDKLGMFAFGEERDDVPYETNTKIEDKILSDLDDHFNSNRGISTPIAAQMVDLKKRKKYTDVFVDSPKQIMYRGMALQKNQLKKLLGNKVKNIDDFISSLSGKSWKKIDTKLIYKPRKNSSSWTIDKKIAEEFAEEVFGEYELILIADAQDDNHKKFSGPRGLYKADISMYEHESEIVCIDNVNVHSILIRLSDIRW